MSGARMFMRFGYPPNALGYCGPEDAVEIAELTAGADHLHRLVEAFLGAWPYLELIAGQAGLGPLDERVVEAYWVGNSLLEGVDTLAWGNSLDDRFRRRAGWDWGVVADSLNAGGVPNHAFHVFCVYPWVGLLGTGAATRAVEVLDRCRIRWGRVLDATGEQVLVESRPLAWDGKTLRLGPERAESVDAPIDPQVANLRSGDRVAVHWNHICQSLSQPQLHSLRRNHERHLAIVNGMRGRMARSLDG